MLKGSKLEVLLKSHRQRLWAERRTNRVQFPSQIKYYVYFSCSCVQLFSRVPSWLELSSLVTKHIVCTYWRQIIQNKLYIVKGYHFRTRHDEYFKMVLTGDNFWWWKNFTLDFDSITIGIKVNNELTAAEGVNEVGEPSWFRLELLMIYYQSRVPKGRKNDLKPSFCFWRSTLSFGSSGSKLHSRVRRCL